MLNISDGAENLGGIKWELVLCLITMWCIVWLCLFKGVKSVGKILLFIMWLVSYIASHLCILFVVYHQAMSHQGCQICEFDLVVYHQAMSHQGCQISEFDLVVYHQAMSHQGCQICEFDLVVYHQAMSHQGCQISEFDLVVYHLIIMPLQ